MSRLPPLFSNNFLDAASTPGVHHSPSTRRARTVTPLGRHYGSNNGSGATSAGSGESHLEEALHLALAIASRMKREGHKTTDSERRLSQQLSDLLHTTGTFSAATSGAATTTAAASSSETLHHSGGGGGGPAKGRPPHPLMTTHGSGVFSPSMIPESPASGAFNSSSSNNQISGSVAGAGLITTPTNSSRPASTRTMGLMGKLKQASAAAFVYKEMAESKEDMSRITQFTFDCANAALNGAAISTVIREQVVLISPETPMSSITLFYLDPNGMLTDPISTKVIAISKSSIEGQCALTKQATVEGDDLAIPLLTTTTGDFLGCLTISNGAKLDEVTRNKLNVIAPIAAMSVRNLLLHETVKWQVDKAEAMLMMANQLSRDNLDERVLVQSIMTTAKQLTESDRCSIFLVNGTVLHAYFEDGKSVTMSIDAGIAGHVAKTGETVNIREAYEDARFNSAVDKATGYRTKTILCMPVHYEGTIVAVAQLINKKPKVGKSGEIARVFSKRDEELFMTFSTFAGVSLRNCRINANLVREKRKSEAVLDVVQMLSDTDIRDVNQIVSHVMLGAKKLLNADRSSLFLIDKERNELYSKVADSTGGKEIRFGSGKGIAGTVASSGIAENIPDAYEDERFNREVDKAFNYRTRSILCEPITCKGDVLAVAQLVNRIDPDTHEVTPFTTEDQATFRTFAMFAGISISNSHLLEFAINAGREAMALNERRGDPGLGQRRPSSAIVTIRPIEETEKAPIRTIQLPEVEFTSRNFDFWGVREATDHPLNAAVAVVMRVITSTGLPQKFKCPEEVLLTFVCQCRRRYRNVPYHNFYHAADACQTVHTFLYEGRVCEVLTDLECFVLMITALVHDLDHMGLNNSFHLKTDSPLGILSSASGNNSVLEVHHCNLAIEILEDPKSNVFIGLTTDELKAAYRGMIDCVLATDMAKHGDLSKVFEAIDVNKDDENDRRMVMEMVMKAADISNVTKPFEVSRKWAMAVTEEFYQQGDKEKEKGVQVLPMFDRSANNELAKGQIGFIDFIAMKFFKIIAAKLPGLQWTVDNIESNKAQWARVLEARRASMIVHSN